MTLYQQVRTLNSRFIRELKEEQLKEESHWVEIYKKYILEFEDIVYNLLVNAMNNSATIKIFYPLTTEYCNVLNYYIPYNKSNIIFAVLEGDIDLRLDGVYSNHKMMMSIGIDNNHPGTPFHIYTIDNTKNPNKHLNLAVESARRLYDRIEKNTELYAWLILQDINPYDMFLIGNTDIVCNVGRVSKIS